MLETQSCLIFATSFVNKSCIRVRLPGSVRPKGVTMKHVLLPHDAMRKSIALTFEKLSARCAHRACRFRTDESGAVVALALFIFIFMLAVAGLGIDLMRHEMKRTHLQATLDSAVLAAAGTKIKDGSNSPENDLQQVIKDYFEAAQIGGYLQDFNDDDIKIGDGKTEALASAKLEMDTYLMRLSGVDTLTAWATTQAAILAETLEIVMVLDVSGSMEGERLTELKKAAKKFVIKFNAHKNSIPPLCTVFFTYISVIIIQ